MCKLKRNFNQLSMRGFRVAINAKIGSKPAQLHLLGTGAGSMLFKFRDIWTIFHGGDTLRAHLQVHQRNLNLCVV